MNFWPYTFDGIFNNLYIDDNIIYRRFNYLFLKYLTIIYFIVVQFANTLEYVNEVVNISKTSSGTHFFMEEKRGQI